MSESTSVDPQSVMAAITMEQVLEHYGILGRFKWSDVRLIGPCPIHKGNDPMEFRVNITKNTWNCLGDCKHGGNVLDFIAILENVTYQAAGMKAAEWFKLNCGFDP